MATALSEKERALIDAYWRAANYLSIGQNSNRWQDVLEVTNRAWVAQAHPAGLAGI